MTRTAAANAVALPDAHRSPATGRRRFLAALASLPIVGTSFFATRADAAMATVVQMIDAAQARCLAAEKAFAAGLATYEASLPRLHPTLDVTKRQVRGWQELRERGFDGANVTRGELHSSGGRFPRYIMTAAYCREQIAEHDDDANLRRFFGRQRRRAEKYEATLRQLEEHLGLPQLAADRELARRDLEKLGTAIFAQPGRSRGAVYAQARMICAIQAVTTREHSLWQVQGWGVRLAESVRDLGRAA